MAKVTAIMISWDNDNLGVDKVEDRLWQVFENAYGYKVTRFKILSNKTTKFAEKSLVRALTTHIDEHDDETSLIDDEMSLIIVVYNSHASGETFYIWSHKGRVTLLYSLGGDP